MSEKLTQQQVRHVAKLSRLKLTDQQTQAMADQLSNVLDYIGKLNELDVQNVQPMAHPTEMTNKFRDDTPQPGLGIDDVLENAAQKDPPFFKVPKVLGDTSSA